MRYMLYHVFGPSKPEPEVKNYPKFRLNLKKLVQFLKPQTITRGHDRVMRYMAQKIYVIYFINILYI